MSNVTADVLRLLRESVFSDEVLQLADGHEVPIADAARRIAV